MLLNPFTNELLTIPKDVLLLNGITGIYAYIALLTIATGDLLPADKLLTTRLKFLREGGLLLAKNIRSNTSRSW
jgi:hypothetical protein